MSPVQAEEWSTIQVSPSNFSIYGALSITYNGSKIAFHSYVKYYLGGGDPFYEDHKIFVANSNGTGLTEIARNCGSPVLSGDGSKIAFTKKGQLFVVNSDGTGLTSPLFKARDISSPSIGGDGKKIAFYADLNANYEGFSNNSDAFVVNSDGTGLTKLASNLNLVDYYWVNPSISVDGSKIAFTKNDYEVFVVNSDGTELTQIPGFPKYGYTKLSISGDGSVIAFTVSGTLFVSVNSDRVLSYSGSEDDAASLETQQTTPILEIVVAASAVSVAIVGIGLLVYFRKRKR